MKSVALHTLGCKLNYSETSTLAKQFEAKGMKLGQYGEKTDVFVLNTCSVTDNADRECRQIIRSVLRKNPDTYVIVTGCYAQLQPEEIAGIEGVDLILGSKEKLRLFDYLENFDTESPSCIFKENGSRIFVSGLDEVNTEISAAYSADIDSRTRAFLKIQDGCDYNCTFCTIPLARGGSRSLPLDTVLDNAKKIVDAGYKEIILTGVNTGDYRYNDEESKSVKKLIDVLYGLEKTSIERVRISSIEPNLLNDEIIGLVKSSERFCKHFHIPLQSGDPEVLKLMRRRYNTELYGSLIQKLNRELPDAGIGVDVIIGFPGETDEYFNNTAEFLSGLKISYLHVFSYSERKNTLAAGFGNKVDVRTRRNRSEILRSISAKKRFDFYSGYLGTRQKVLFESSVVRLDGKDYIEGWTSNYIRVKMPFDAAMQNKIVEVELNNLSGIGPVDCIV